METDNKQKRFSTIYEQYVNDVYQYIYMRSGFEETIAEDITQDIFLAVYRGMDGFKGLCSQRTWIFRIVKNKLYDYYRQQYRYKGDCEQLEEESIQQIRDPLQDMDLMAIRTFEGETVRRCLKQLPLHYRTALLMKYSDNKSIKEIAEFSGKSYKAAESMLQRARAAFIKEYRQEKEKEDG